MSENSRILDKRNRFLQQVARIDIQMMVLSEQMTEVFQKAIDLDIEATGGISDITREFVETFHYKVEENGKVSKVQMMSFQEAMGQTKVFKDFPPRNPEKNSVCDNLNKNKEKLSERMSHQERGHEIKKK